MVRRNLGLLLLCVLLAAPAARAQVPDGAAKASTEGASPLRPGDVIRLRIWREPDLDGNYPVDERGIVILPKIGVFQVTEEAPAILREKIVSEFRRYLVNPSIEVVFLRRINILGAVRNPGLFPIDPTLTVADVLAMAGGALPNGEPDKVKLIREGATLTTRITQRTRVADLPIRSGDQLFVPERSWFSRNSAVVVSSLISVAVALIYVTN